LSQPKACPECKSKNTRQMETKSDSAYCLSCYNVFRSFDKSETRKVNEEAIKAKIIDLKSKIEKLEKEIT